MKKNVSKKRKILGASALFALLLSLALVLIGCGSGRADLPADYNNGADGGYGKDYYEESVGGSSGTDGYDDVISDQRYVIKTVNATVNTESYDELVSRVKSATNRAGGYYSSASFVDGARRGGSRYASITVKVPAENLDSFIAELSEVGTLSNYTEYVDDVTLEYIDLDSRIKTLEAEEEALLGILEKAQTVQDMMSVRENLNSVQSDLASLKARKESLASRIAFSTVNLSLYEVRLVEPAEDASFGEELRARFVGSASSIGDGLRSIALFLLGDILYIVIVAAFAVAAILLVRAFILRKRKSSDSDI